jgi:hypothetical protein
MAGLQLSPVVNAAEHPRHKTDPVAFFLMMEPPLRTNGAGTPPTVAEIGIRGMTTASTSLSVRSPTGQHRKTTP